MAALALLSEACRNFQYFLQFYVQLAADGGDLFIAELSK
jgi:hypothetical protein